LVPQVTLQAFGKWSIDFIGPINPPRKRSGVRYTITTIDYLTRWVKAQPVRDCGTKAAAKFFLSIYCLYWMSKDFDE